MRSDCAPFGIAPSLSDGAPRHHSLLAITIALYALLGMEAFGFVAHGQSLDAQRNFEVFPNAVLLLFQCLTGDGWSGLMTDARVEAASGGCSDADGTCGTWLATPYFVTYQVRTPLIASGCS